MKPLEEMGEFKTVVVDPPWNVSWRTDKPETLEGVYANARLVSKGERQVTPGYTLMRYDTMDLESIVAMPVESVLEHDALVFVWTTQEFLRHTFGIIEQWGLKYHYVMTWQKPWGPKPLRRPMYNSEFIVVGGRGASIFTDEHMLFTAYCWPNPRKHSEKPEEFYDLLRRVTPGPRLDVFGRRRIAGFTSWGNEAPEGEPLPDHYQQVLMDV